MHVIYILHLAENKFYVGKTALGNLENRVEQHKAQQGASAWTSLYRVQSLVHSYVTPDALAEDHETERLMLCYGIDNVRGGMYAEVCHPSLRRALLPPTCLQQPLCAGAARQPYQDAADGQVCSRVEPLLRMRLDWALCKRVRGSAPRAASQDAVFRVRVRRAPRAVVPVREHEQGQAAMLPLSADWAPGQPVPQRWGAVAVEFFHSWCHDRKYREC